MTTKKKTSKPDTSALRAAKKQKPNLQDLPTKRKTNLKPVPSAPDPAYQEHATPPEEVKAVGGGHPVEFRPKDFNCHDFERPTNWVDELAAGLAPTFGLRAIRVGAANVGFYGDKKLADEACTIYGLLRNASWKRYQEASDGRAYDRSWQTDFLRGYAAGIHDQAPSGDIERAQVPVPGWKLLTMPETSPQSEAFDLGEQAGGGERLDEAQLREFALPPKPVKQPKEPKAKKEPKPAKEKKSRKKKQQPEEAEAAPVSE